MATPTKLDAIFAALAALPITVTHMIQGTAIQTIVNARALDELPNVVDTASLPLRVLSPFHDMEGEIVPRTIAVGGAGTKTANVWQISDMCLWQSETQGTGMSQTAPPVVAYINAYTEVIARNLKIIDGALIEKWKPKPGIYPYPNIGENSVRYYAILMTLIIKEIQ